MMAKKDRLLALFILLLSIAAVAMWKANLMLANEIYDVHRLSSRSNLQYKNTASVPIGEHATSFKLNDTEGNVVSFNPKSSRLAMLIFFNPTDCSWCLLESALWKEVSEFYDPTELYVLGIITRANVSLRDVAVFKNGRRLKFPILVGEGAHEVSHAYGVTHTPTRILVDHKGTIVDAGYSVHNPTEHDLFKKKVAMLLNTRIE